MHHLLRPRLGALTLFLTMLLAVGPAACASDEPAGRLEALIDADIARSAQRDARLEAALDRVVASPTGRFHYETFVAFGVDPTGAVEPDLEASDVVKGAFDRPAGRFALWSGPGAHAEMLRAESPEGARMAEGSDFILDGLAIYWRHPFSLEVLGIEGWIGGLGIDRATVAELTQDPAVGFDPAAVAELLRGADRLEHEGKDDVRGVQAERHRTTIDLDDVLDRVHPDRQEAVGRQLDDVAAVLEQFGPPSADRSVDALVWLTDDGDLVRLELEVPVADGVFGDGASMRGVLDLYDYGAPIVIEVPDPAEVQPPPGL
ncbi:MAG: hypothetical protein M3Z03_13665 [Actinomycetota bacterium]|nr:hypothetical protein [Actinomycetota bacterium]